MPKDFFASSQACNSQPGSGCLALGRELGMSCWRRGSGTAVIQHYPSHPLLIAHPLAELSHSCLCHWQILIDCVLHVTAWGKRMFRVREVKLHKWSCCFSCMIFRLGEPSLSSFSSQGCPYKYICMWFVHIGCDTLRCTLCCTFHLAVYVKVVMLLWS